MMTKVNTEKIINELKTLGTVEDYSHTIIGVWENQISHAFELLEGKHIVLAHDLLFVYLFRDGTFEITTDSIPYPMSSNQDAELFRSCFSLPNFIVKINEKTRKMSVTGKGHELTQLKELILAYRKANDTYVTKKLIQPVSLENNCLSFIDCSKEARPYKNGLVLGKLGSGRAIRHFRLADFQEELACGYVKLEHTDYGLMVKVIDTYNQETLEEEQELLGRGFTKLGYPTC